MDLEVYNIVLLPIIIGIIEIFKRAGLPKRYAPLVSLGLGIIIGIIYFSENGIPKGVLTGVYLGLSSNGLHSGTKNIIEERKNND